MTLLGEDLTSRALELSARREPFVRATVVRAQHPTSAHAGDTAIVRENGEIDGFVGGNCVEASVREYGLRTLVSREPLLLRVVPGEPSRVDEEGAVEVANPCLSGGAIEIFLEPQLPPARVIVVGGTPVAKALARIGADLGLEMELTDGASVTPRADDAAPLRVGVPYVALVASETRGTAVLASLDVDEQQRARVHSPAGLPIGARTPAEIALSILAQLVAERSTGRLAGTAREPEPATAIDPVCGMSVAAVEASLHVELDGVTTYFCSPGCRNAFLANPERYAVTS
jgi:xanthine dehydrogenase accessory factor